LSEDLLAQILSKELQEFISTHEKDDPVQLALKLAKEKNPLVKEIVNQIKSRQKAKEKLPSFYNTPKIIYPEYISMEQCSSEKTAAFKAGYFRGKTLIDLSAGFGVDALFLAKNFQEVILIEPNQELQEIVKHNYSCFGVNHAKFINSTAEDFLNSYKGKADCIYIDPSRRTQTNQKAVLLSDYKPDVPKILDRLFEISQTILIKTAPLLDIQAALTELSCVAKVIVVSVNNDCKEVLYLLIKNFSEEPEVETVNHKAKKKQLFKFKYSSEKKCEVKFSLPETYLYEPNSSVMKAGAFKTIADHFKLNKLHPNSHLYTSDQEISDFPGRIFKSEAVVKPDKKEISKYLPEGKANISLRNFKGTVQEFQKKMNIKDGGEKYLFATTDPDGKPICIIASQISVLAASVADVRLLID
jgi:ubiquinone/menaquinone biosynthesis C-methylase UbiE